jgi:hypothetical protein
MSMRELGQTHNVTLENNIMPEVDIGILAVFTRRQMIASVVATADPDAIEM